MNIKSRALDIAQLALGIMSTRSSTAHATGLSAVAVTSLAADIGSSLMIALLFWPVFSSVAQALFSNGLVVAERAQDSLERPLV
jgi:hypothetical protein